MKSPILEWLGGIAILYIGYLMGGAKGVVVAIIISVVLYLGFLLGYRWDKPETWDDNKY